MCHRGRMSHRWGHGGGRATVALAAVTALPVLLTGCTGDRTPTTTTPTAARPEATSLTPLARSTWQPGQNSMSALATGTLHLDDDGCVRLVMEGDDEDERTPVLWPRGWVAEPSSGGVVIRDPSGTHTVRTGTVVELGGGYLQEDRYDPQPCATGPAWQVSSCPSPAPDRPRRGSSSSTQQLPRPTRTSASALGEPSARCAVSATRAPGIRAASARGRAGTSRDEPPPHPTSLLPGTWGFVG